MASKKNNTGGGMIASAITSLILGGAVLGWVNVNNIDSGKDVYDYFRSWSDKVQACGAVKATWHCDMSLNPGDGSRSVLNGNKPSLPKPPPPGGYNFDLPDKRNVNAKAPTYDAPKDALLAGLDKIPTIDKPGTEYSRSDWKHWIGEPCDTRMNVLRAQGKEVQPAKTASSCRVKSGAWVDPYSGDKFSDPKQLDIDHVIPLGYAAKHGGAAWDASKKQNFANDMSQLLAVSAKENRSKSDKGPKDYMPPKKEFHCEYSKIWTATALKYGVSLEPRDKAALRQGLQRCGQ